MNIIYRDHDSFDVCFVVFLVFFTTIPDVNLVMLCLRQNLHVLFLVVCVSFSLFLIRVCFCLDIYIVYWGRDSFPVCFVGCFLLSLHNSCCLFADAMFAHNWKAFHFYRLGEFWGIVGSFLLLLGCMHDLYGAWTMVCVLVSRFADFFGKCVRT